MVFGDARNFILLQSVMQSDILTYFNNFLGFNKFDQICHKLSLVTGHHHSTPGMISSELERGKNQNTSQQTKCKASKTVS